MSKQKKCLFLILLTNKFNEKTMKVRLSSLSLYNTYYCNIIYIDIMYTYISNIFQKLCDRAKWHSKVRYTPRIHANK